MYFDAVFSPYGVLLFNGTPEETQKFIKRESIVSNAYVVEGMTMKIYSVQEYCVRSR